MGQPLDELYFSAGIDATKFNRALADMDASASSAGKKIGSHLDNAGAGAERLHRGIEVSRRELLYFGREVATGDFARLPATLALIGSHLAGITGMGILRGGAIAAPFLLLATAAYQANTAIDKLNRSLAASGNSGNRDTVLNIATQAANGGISKGRAIGLLTALTASGNVQTQNLLGAVQASDAYGKMTGLDTAKSGEAVEKLLSNPAKAALELQQNFKLLTNAQVLEIQTLQAHGDTAKAQKEIDDALVARGKKVDESMWSLSKAFDGLGARLGTMWFNTGANLTGPKTPQQQYDALTAQRDFLAKNNRPFPYNTDAQIAEIDRQRGNLHYQIRTDPKTVAAAAQQAATDAQNKKDEDERRLRDAGHLALARFSDAGRISGAAPRDRELLAARLAAARDYTSNLNNPEMAGYAGGIRSAQITAAITEQNNKRKDALTLVQQSAAAERDLADAYRRGAAAGSEQESTNKAHAEFLAGAIDNEKGYAAALMQTAQAQRAIAAAKADQKQDDENASLILQLSLMNQDEDLRAKLLADLEVENRLKEEGWDLTTAAGRAELALEQAKVDKKSEYLALIKKGTEQQQGDLSVLSDGMGAVSSIFDHINQGAQGLSRLIPDLSQQIVSMIEKLYILNPIQNALTGSLTGTAGKLPTGKNLSSVGANSGLNSVFAAAGSWLGKLFGGGGAWSGGVRYAADGMVLNGPTAFSAPGGPVIGGELGKNSEALIPLYRAPDGKLGVRNHSNATGPGKVHVTQMINVHPDVSAVARQEIITMLPALQSSAVKAFNDAMMRGFAPGG